NHHVGQGGRSRSREIPAHHRVKSPLTISEMRNFHRNLQLQGVATTV
ncbi:hypothetical protein ABIB00_007977, partial [Bradyrhizobium sp. LB14.3]